ncbi:MAG: flagellar protein [Lachnospiraceae bacterium]|nr:flagellar protein [Candidatus Merdinaster equi]
MNVRNCRSCGKIFNYLSGPPICQACKDAREAKFQEVKAYVYEHRQASIPQIAQDCEVETSQIQQWIREERLVFAEDSPIGVNCENCGAMIRTGRFCEKCKKDMVGQLSMAGRRPAAPEPVKKQTREDPRMRFLDR